MNILLQKQNKKIIKRTEKIILDLRTSNYGIIYTEKCKYKIT